MKLKFGYIFGILATVCLLSVLCGSARAVADGRATATVVAQRGQAKIERNGAAQYESLEVQDLLYAGDTVKTSGGGEVEIVFSDGSQLKLDSNTTVRITQGIESARSQTIFQAMFGVIWARLRPGQTIETPTAQMLVRGTEVTVAVADDGTSQMTVVSGEVTFFNNKGTVNLSTNQQSIAAPGEAPTAPIAVDASGLISWTADVVGLPLVFESPDLDKFIAPEAANEKAVSQLTDYLAVNGGDVGSWIKRGNLRRALGDAPGAESDFAHALTLDGSNAAASEGLALTQLSQGHMAEAQTDLGPVAQQPCPIAILGLIDLETGGTVKAVAEFQSALSLDPSLYSARDLLALAYLQEGDLTDADQEAKSAAALAPKSAQAEGTLSTVLLFEGNVARAGALARMAVSIDPQSPFALMAAGRCLVSTGHYEEARSDFERAVAFGPRLWLLHEELGEVYDRLGMPMKASEEYRAALVLDPASWESYAGLGKTLQEEGKYSAAETDFEQAVALDPKSASARYAYASFLVDRGDLNGALAQINAVTNESPNFGLLYARLAEIYLYKQNLSEAQRWALKAVSLLPRSGIAHYELGRVYIEEEHTYQAEQEFRIATVYDPRLSSARYALGLVEEKTQSDLLSHFSSISDSAFVGSPASSVNLNDLTTPGENERLQAALSDPTAVRAATRSYGNTELDAVGGSAGSDNLAASYLTETAGGQGVAGASGSSQFERGPRPHADYTDNNAEFVAGRDAREGRIGYLALGDYDQTNQGLDLFPTENPLLTTARIRYQTLNLTTGIKISTVGGGDVEAILHGSDQQIGFPTIVPTTDPNYASGNINTDSLDGEVRWDVHPESQNSLTAGLSYGNRHRTIYSVANTPFGLLQIPGYARLSPLQGYLRDEITAGPRWSFVAQLQLIQEFSHLGSSSAGDVFPASSEANGTTKVTPYLIASYQVDPATLLRVRFHRLISSVDDFELLKPEDVFLISFVDLLQAIDPTGVPLPEGTSTEAELDKTMGHGTFLSVGVFRQDLLNPSLEINGFDDGIATAQIQGVQASYQGLVSKYVSYFLLGEAQNVEDTSTPQRVPLLPNFVGVSTVQYLNRAGFYGQVSYYYQGDRITQNVPGEETGYGTDLGAFGVLDLRVGKRIGLSTNIFAELKNALDKQYDDFNYIQQGSEVRIGATQRF